MTEAEKPQEVTYEEVMLKYMAEHENPVMQVLAEYLRETETGEFDQEKVSQLVHRTMVTRFTEYYSHTDYPPEYPNDPFFEPEEYVRASIPYDAPVFGGLLDEVKTYLIRKSKEINGRVVERMKVIDKTNDIVRLKRIFERITKSISQQLVPFDELDKNRYVQDQYRKRANIHPDMMDPDHEDYVENYVVKLDPTYKQVIKEADFQEKTELRKDQEPELSLEELKGMYFTIAGSVYERVCKVVDPSSKRQIEVSSNKFSTPSGYEERIFVSIDGNKRTNFPDILSQAISKVQTINPELYLEFSAQNDYLHLLSHYIENFNTQDTKKRYLTEIQESVSNPVDFIAQYKQVNTDFIDLKNPQENDVYIFTRLIETIQRLDRPKLLKVSMAGTFGKSADGEIHIEELTEFLERQKLTHEVFKMDKGEVTKRLTELGAYIEGLNDVPLVWMQGDPLHVARFPNEVSYMSQEQEQSGELVEYSLFSQGLDLNPQVLIVNWKPFAVNENSNSKINLALPSYAPIVNIRLSPAVNSGGRSKPKEFTHGVDYSLLYEKKSGQYQIHLLSDEAIAAGKVGLTYEASLDFIEKQKEVPRKVDKIDISVEKLGVLCDSLRQAGFDQLAEKLEQSLKKTFVKQIRAALKGETFQTNSSDVAKAIRDSIYYSFENEEADLQTANDIIASGLEGELDFSFLPETDRGRRAKIKVQCRHVAKLYSVIVNYLYDQNGKEGSLSASRLFADSTPDKDKLKGYKLFTMPHSDTRGAFSNDSETVRFEEDLTPNASKKDDKKIKAETEKKDKIIQQLSEVKVELGGKLSPAELMYVEIASGETSFKELVIRMKKELASFTPVFKGNTTLIEKFALSPPGSYNTPDRLLDIMRTKPLAAVLNILLYFQDKGPQALKNAEDMVLIKKVLTAEMEVFEAAKSRNNIPNRIASADRVFVEEVHAASRIAEKLVALIEAVENEDIEPIAA